MPPASVPLSFLGAAGVALAGFGLAAWFAADKITRSPTAGGAVSAAHLALLGFLTTAVLGALHQFVPVISRRTLRSVTVARASMVGIVAAGWSLPSGFAHGPEWLVPLAASVGVASVAAAIWNLSGPLSARHVELPLVGVRIALAYLGLTVSFGVVYAFDRHVGWFPLFPNRVMAHAHLGLLGWLGITYVAVAEKLWPMFLLSHRPRARSGVCAVTLLGVGVLPLALGLLLASRPLALVGGVAVVTGLGFHMISLVGTVRHRRRRLELLHAYLFGSSTFLVVAVTTGTVAGLAPVESSVRARLVTAEVVGLFGWLAGAVVGHAHKIVPFIAYTVLRSKGIRRSASGRPLLFSDLYHRRTGWLFFLVWAAAMSAFEIGVLARSQEFVAVGGTLLTVAAVGVVANLTIGPLSVARSLREVTS